MGVLAGLATARWRGGPAPRGPGSGRTVVVGGGLAGLSAALHLAGAGRRVTVLEREPHVGGRAARVDATGRSGAAYRLDVGPSVLTMPDLLADAFAAVGDDVDARLTLHRVDPAYRAHFADGSRLELTSDRDTMRARIAALSGADDAAAYDRFVAWVTALYRVELGDLIDRNTDSPLDLARPALARVLALRGFGRLGPEVERLFADPRLHRVFSFQSVSAGLAPQQALALFAVGSYMDLVEGVFYPEGGMHAMAAAMADAATAAGVEVVTGAEVTGVHWAAGPGSRVDDVRTADRAHACDEVVVTLDAPAALRLLGLDEQARRARALLHSPSCVVLAAGLTPGWRAPDVHHSVHFGTAWDGLFEDLLAGRAMRDPSWLLSVPSLTSPSMAPDGGTSAYLLFPTPNLDAGDPATRLDWDTLRGPYRDHVLRTVDAAHPGFSDALDAEVMLTPLDWQASGLAAGTPFATSQTLGQTGPLRTPNVVADGVVLAGSSTVPGAGVPMVLVSGRLAAERLTGPVAGYASRARR